MSSDGAVGSSCGVNGHVSSKFAPEFGAFYIPATGGTSLFADTCVNAANVSPEQLNVLQGGYKDDTGWRTFFRTCEKPTAAGQAGGPVPRVFFVQTPDKPKRDPDNDKDDDEERSWLEEEEVPDQPDLEGLTRVIQRIAHKLAELAKAGLGMARDLEARLLMIADNLRGISNQAESTHARIGYDKKLEQEYGTLWGAIRGLLAEWLSRQDDQATTFAQKAVRNVGQLKDVVCKIADRI